LIIFGANQKIMEIIDSICGRSERLGDVIQTKQGLIPYLTKEEGKENKYISEYQVDAS
jgi:hypothetical protein